MKKQCKRNENRIISLESAVQQSRSMPEGQGKKAQRSIADEESVALSFSENRNKTGEREKNLLILGAGEYGQVAKEVACSMHCFDKIGFLDDKLGVNYSEDKKCSVVGRLDEYRNFLTLYSNAFVAIGKAEVRLHYLEKLGEAGFCLATLISPKAYIASSAQLKCGSIVEPMSVINANSSIGNGVFVCAGAIVNHNCIIGNGCTLQCGSVVPANSVVAAKTLLDYNDIFTQKDDSRKLKLSR